MLAEPEQTGELSDGGIAFVEFARTMPTHELVNRKANPGSASCSGTLGARAQPVRERGRQLRLAVGHHTPALHPMVIAGWTKPVFFSRTFSQDHRVEREVATNCLLAGTRD